MLHIGATRGSELRVVMISYVVATPSGRKCLAALQKLGDIPPQLLVESQFPDATLPVLGGDYTMAATYVVPKQGELSCPVSTFAGLGHMEVPPEDVRAWSRHTGFYRVHLLNTARLDQCRLVMSERPPTSS